MQLAEATERVHALERELVASREEMERAESNLVLTIANEVAQRTALEERIALLESELEATSQRAALTENLRDQLALLTSQIEEAEARVTVLSTELTRTREAHDSAEAALLAAKNEASQLAQEHARQMAERDANLSDLLLAKATLEERASLVESRLASLSTRHEALKDAAQQLHGRLTHEELRSASLVDEVSHLQQKLVEATNQSEELQTTVRSLSDERDQSQGETQRLTLSLAEAEDLVQRGRDQLVAEVERRARLEARVQSLVQEAAESRRVIAVAEATQRQQQLSIDHLARVTGELQESLFSSEARVRQTGDAMAGLTAECERLRAQLVLAMSRGEEVDHLRAQLAVEHFQREQLQWALIEALRDGQEIARQLDGILASRSYRYGRRLTAPGRLLFGPSSEGEPQ